jgi:hypothetical protein
VKGEWDPDFRRRNAREKDLVCVTHERIIRSLPQYRFVLEIAPDGGCDEGSWLERCGGTFGQCPFIGNGTGGPAPAVESTKVYLAEMAAAPEGWPESFARPKSGRIPGAQILMETRMIASMRKSKIETAVQRKRRKKVSSEEIITVSKDCKVSSGVLEWPVHM